MKKSYEIAEEFINRFKEEGVEIEDTVEVLVSLLSALTVTSSRPKEFADITAKYYLDRCNEMLKVKEENK